jgi:hypothetical protein
MRANTPPSSIVAMCNFQFCLQFVTVEEKEGEEEEEEEELIFTSHISH